MAITTLLRDFAESRRLAKASRIFAKAPELGRIGEMSIRGIGTVNEGLSRTVIDRLGILAAKYPEVAARMPNVGIIGAEAPEPINKMWRKLGSGRAQGMSFLEGSSIRDRLGLDMAFHQGHLHMGYRTSEKAGFSSGWGVAEQLSDPHDFAASVVDHEFGHHGHDLLMARAMHTAGVPGAYPKTAAQIAAVRPIFEGSDSWGTLVGSEYANKSHYEAFAELFAAHERGMVDSPAMARLQTEMSTPGQPPRSRTPRRGRHSTARMGLPVRSSAPARFRPGRFWH